jgi:hypothetical protein
MATELNPCADEDPQPATHQKNSGRENYNPVAETVGLIPSLRMRQSPLISLISTTPHLHHPLHPLYTPIWGHIGKRGQVEQCGEVPVQMCLPNGTSRLLISTQYC